MFVVLDQDIWELDPLLQLERTSVLSSLDSVKLSLRFVYSTFWRNGGRRQLPAFRFLSLSLVFSSSSSIGLPLSFLLSSSRSTFLLSGGEDKGLCGLFILPHSEGWLQCIVGNRIQLCCRLCLCVCWCEHVQECACVCVCGVCAAGLTCTLTCFMSFWRRRFSFITCPYLHPYKSLRIYCVPRSLNSRKLAVTSDYEFLTSGREHKSRLWDHSVTLAG